MLALITLLFGVLDLNNVRHTQKGERKTSWLYHAIHWDGGIVVYLKTKKQETEKF